ESRAVHDRIDAARRCERVLHDLRGLLGVADIGGEDERLAVDLVGRLFELFAPPAAQHACKPLVSELHSRRAPNAAAGSCDDGNTLIAHGSSGTIRGAGILPAVMRAKRGRDARATF